MISNRDRQLYRQNYHNTSKVAVYEAQETAPRFQLGLPAAFTLAVLGAWLAYGLL